MKLTKTQNKLIAEARESRIHVQTYAYRSGRFRSSEGGAREWGAAEGLVKLGLAELIERKSGSAQVRSSNGYRRQSWVDHLYRLTDAGVALQADALAEARAEGAAARKAGVSSYRNPHIGPQRDAWDAGWRA